MEEMKTEHAAALRKKETQVCIKPIQSSLLTLLSTGFTDYAAQHTHQSIQTGIYCGPAITVMSLQSRATSISALSQSLHPFT